jgi:hypothetical protein
LKGGVLARLYFAAAPQKVLYTIEGAVGRGVENRHDDVLLVQLFLRVQMEEGGSEPPYRPPGRDPLAIDGICGDNTLAYILYFQQEAKRRFPVAPTPDGRVDPMRSGTLISSITKNVYMIVALNVGYREKRGDMILDIGRDPFFPQGLKKSFYIS